MWFKEYRDYPNDTPLIKERVDPNHGIIGAEMHDINGWGTSFYRPKKKKRGLLASLFSLLFGRRSNERS